MGVRSISTPAGGGAQVLGSFGKGVFSTVVRCQDLQATASQHAEVAVKVQRNNEMMRRAGEKEIGILERLVENDPENRKHCIQMLARFDHEDHLCMVFEAMHQVQVAQHPASHH